MSGDPDQKTLGEHGFIEMMGLLNRIDQRQERIERRQERFEQSQEKLEKRLTDHMDAEEKFAERQNEELASLRKEVAAFFKAFPVKDGAPDVDGHRSDHETRIQEASRSRKFWEGIRAKAAENVLNALMIGAVIIFGLGLQDWMAAWMNKRAESVTQTAPAVADHGSRQ